MQIELTEDEVKALIAMCNNVSIQGVQSAAIVIGIYNKLAAHINPASNGAMAMEQVAESEKAGKKAIAKHS